MALERRIRGGEDSSLSRSCDDGGQAQCRTKDRGLKTLHDEHVVDYGVQQQPLVPAAGEWFYVHALLSVWWRPFYWYDHKNASLADVQALPNEIIIIESFRDGICLQFE